MNGARTPRSAINSSTMSAESRSLKSRGSARDGLSRARRPQNSVANVVGSVPMQRLSTAKRSRGSVGTAVAAFGVRAAVGGAFAARGSVGSTVVAFGVRAAVGGAFAARGSVGSTVVACRVRAAVGGTLPTATRGGDVVVIEWHGDPFPRCVRAELPGTDPTKRSDGRNIPGSRAAYRWGVERHDGSIDCVAAHGDTSQPGRHTSK